MSLVQPQVPLRLPCYDLALVTNLIMIYFSNYNHLTLLNISTIKIKLLL